MTKCWICGNLATTGEHIVKRTDIVRLFGKGPYQAEKRLQKKVGGKNTLLQSENSNHLKYKRILCHYCNSTRTQKDDYAYDKFIDYTSSNYNKILKEELINLKMVYGSGVKKQQVHLFKYFIKSFGCKLASSGLTVPQELIQTFHGRNIPKTLILTFSIFKPYLELNKQIKGSVGSQNLVGLHDRIMNTYINLFWSEFIGWLCISYWYKRAANSDLGVSWSGKRKIIELGCFE